MDDKTLYVSRQFIKGPKSLIEDLTRWDERKVLYLFFPKKKEFERYFCYSSILFLKFRRNFLILDT